MRHKSLACGTLALHEAVCAGTQPWLHSPAISPLLAAWRFREQEKCAVQAVQRQSADKLLLFVFSACKQQVPLLQLAAV
jgi:hypothetical protein